jgi:hypothetical protein
VAIVQLLISGINMGLLKGSALHLNSEYFSFEYKKTRDAETFWQ